MKKQRQTSPRRRSASKRPATTTDPVAPERKSHIELGSACTLQEASAIRVQCLAALAGEVEPVIEGGAVERVDAAGTQVLVAFAIDCMERSVDFSWAGRSPALARAIRLLGVEALLESPGRAAIPAVGVP